MNGKKIASVAAAGIIAGVVPTAGCASATTAGSAAKTGKGTAHIMVYSINSDGPRFQAIVTGAVGDYGPGVTVHPNGTVDPEHTSELQLNLTRGSFRLSIAAIGKEVRSAYRHWPSNPATCSGGITVTGSAPVVASSGTGAYRGISGAFKMTVTIDEVDVKQPGCDATSKFLSQVILMNGTGAVSD